MTTLITGTSSGVGAELLQYFPNGIGLTRNDIDMDIADAVEKFVIPNNITQLINVAGHDLGGKVDFINHSPNHWYKILNTNLINVIALTQKVLQQNKNAEIVNITSTNNSRYYPNDLIYSLSKKALSEFTKMLRIEYNNITQFKEIELGLTKTNFVNNRYKENHAEKIDLYQMYPCMNVDDVAIRILQFLQSGKEYIKIAL